MAVKNAAALLCLSCLIRLAGCNGPSAATGEPDSVVISAVQTNPIGAMTDPHLTVNERVQAVRMVGASTSVDEKNRIEALKDVFSAARQPLDVRTTAFETLYQLNPEAAKSGLEYRLPSLPAWDFIEWACDKIAQNKWVEMTPSLVRSMSRQSPYDLISNRPDYKALQTLYPGQDMREIVFSVVVEPPKSIVQEQWRLSAWELLNTLGPADEWQKRLATLDSTDPLLTTLRAGWTDLHVMARTREELKWLEWLHDPVRKEVWAHDQNLVSSLSEAQRSNLRLRHLVPLSIVSQYHPQWLTEDAAALRKELTDRIGESRHFDPSYILTVGTNSPQSFARWRDELSWADLITIRLALEMTFDQAIEQQALTQTALDRLDTFTEYGGLLLMSEHGPLLKLYQPLQRGSDERFYAPEEMITAGYAAPFHFHFHAQKADDADFAGPGSGDVQYAHMMAINGIVFTTINPRFINVDFYTEGGVVVDLGSFEPPEVRKSE